MDGGMQMVELGAERSIAITRPAHSSHFPLSRLLQIVVLLQTERCPNARRLAEICEVSRRTIYRDLATLADAGITVVYRADRQGYELSRSLFLQPLRIEEREVAALLVLCGRWENRNDLGLSELADRAVGKLIQSMPDSSRDRLLNTAEVLVPPRDPGAEPVDGSDIHEVIFEAISRRKQVRLWFLEPDGAEPEATKFAIYRLTRVGGRWSLVGRSSRHCQVISLPIEQIARAEVTRDDTTIPPRFDLKRHLAGREDGRGSRRRVSQADSSPSAGVGG